MFNAHVNNIGKTIHYSKAILKTVLVFEILAEFGTNGPSVIEYGRSMDQETSRHLTARIGFQIRPIHV
jgi:hypothetical protein